MKAELTDHQKRKHAQGLCTHNGCTTDHAPNRLLCYKHRSQAFKENNYLMYTFNALRNNARRRRKEFLLTIQEFAIFCNDTAYLERKGQNPYSATIDRIKSDQGYSYDNIQIMDHIDNTMKSNSDIYETVEEPF
ncbi:MAG: hypothetical protein WC707_06830 [Candidatus Babeliaceae bacterium]|jgi:hypothetical protein